MTAWPDPVKPAPPSAGAWIIPIRGDIEPSLSVFVRRETRKALERGADFLIFEIDTFGGRVDSALQITSFISSIKRARTAAWIHNGDESMGVSWSAGALIALSCRDIYMATGTSLGAAAPVALDSTGAMESAGEKAVAAIRSQIAALAERNGHPVGIALAMVDYDVDLWEVRVNGTVQALTESEVQRLELDPAVKVERLSALSPPGKLLSLSSGEARRLGLSRGVIDERDSLLKELGAGNILGESVPGLADDVITLLTSGPVQAALIIAGLVLIFLEINTPGFGLPGIGAVIAFLLVFGSGFLLGKVGSLEILLFLAGVVLLAVELFITPGFGFLGVSGLLLMGFSLIFSMQDFVIPQFAWEWGLLGRNALVVAGGIIAAVCGIALVALAGPKVPLVNRLTLKTQITGTAGGPDADLAPEADLAGTDYLSLLGKTGVACSPLRPSGRAEIDGRFYTVEGMGLYIASGASVRVVKIQGNRILVRV
jgi:membrane-bound serine protease (ClpP class)